MGADFVQFFRVSCDCGICVRKTRKDRAQIRIDCDNQGFGRGTVRRMGWRVIDGKWYAPGHAPTEVCS